MNLKHVVYQPDNDIVTISINRPECRNAVNPETAAELYLAGHEYGFPLIEGLQGCKGERVFQAFEHALDHGEHWLRWYALQGFNRWKMKEHVPVFVKALQDRSDDIKAVAIRWLRLNGDESAIAPLERVIALKELQQSHPKDVDCARRAVAAIRAGEI